MPPYTPVYPSLRPTTNHGWGSPVSRLAEKVVSYEARGHRLFMPWVDQFDQMGLPLRKAVFDRHARRLLHHETVKAALLGKLYAVSSLDLQTTPVSDEPRDMEVSEFLRYAYTDVLSIPELVMQVYLPGHLFGTSVSELVWYDGGGPWPRGRWKGKRFFGSVKSRGACELIKDCHGNVIKVRGPAEKGGWVEWDPEGFLIYEHLPLFGGPGVSDLLAAYKLCWKLDAIKTLHEIHLERYTSPSVVATFNQDVEMVYDPVTKTRVPIQSQLETELKAFRSRTWLVVPEGVQVSALQLATHGEAEFLAACKDLEEKIVLSIAGAYLQMLTSQGGSSDMRGNSQTQKSTSELFTWALAAGFSPLLNRQASPLLVRENYGPDTDIPKVSLSSVNYADMQQSMQLHEAAQRLGAKLSAKAFYRTYSLQQATDPDDVLGKPDPEPQPPQGMAGAMGFSEGPPQPPQGGAPVGTPPPKPTPAPPTRRTFAEDVTRIFTGKEGFTGTVTDKLGRKYHYVKGKRVKAPHPNAPEVAVQPTKTHDKAHEDHERAQRAHADALEAHGAAKELLAHHGGRLTAAQAALEKAKALHEAAATAAKGRKVPKEAKEAAAAAKQVLAEAKAAHGDAARQHKSAEKVHAKLGTVAEKAKGKLDTAAAKAEAEAGKLAEKAGKEHGKLTAKQEKAAAAAKAKAEKEAAKQAKKPAAKPAEKRPAAKNPAEKPSAKPAGDKAPAKADAGPKMTPAEVHAIHERVGQLDRTKNSEINAATRAVGQMGHKELDDLAGRMGLRATGTLEEKRHKAHQAIIHRREASIRGRLTGDDRHEAEMARARANFDEPLELPTPPARKAAATKPAAPEAPPREFKPKAPPPRPTDAAARDVADAYDRSASLTDAEVAAAKDRLAGMGKPELLQAAAAMEHRGMENKSETEIRRQLHARIVERRGATQRSGLLDPVRANKVVRDAEGNLINVKVGPRPAAKADDTPFTGTDAQGREWRDGKLVAKADEGAGKKPAGGKTAAKADEPPAPSPKADGKVAAKPKVTAEEAAASIRSIADRVADPSLEYEHIEDAVAELAHLKADEVKAAAAANGMTLAARTKQGMLDELGRKLRDRKASVERTDFRPTPGKAPRAVSPADATAGPPPATPATPGRDRPRPLPEDVPAKAPRPQAARPPLPGHLRGHADALRDAGERALSGAMGEAEIDRHVEGLKALPAADLKRVAEDAGMTLAAGSKGKLAEQIATRLKQRMATHERIQFRPDSPAPGGSPHATPAKATNPDDTPFTGTDAQGREWRDGKLVAKADEPAVTPVAKKGIDSLVRKTKADRGKLSALAAEVARESGAPAVDHDHVAEAYSRMRGNPPQAVGGAKPAAPAAAATKATDPMNGHPLAGKTKQEMLAGLAAEQGRMLDGERNLRDYREQGPPAGLDLKAFEADVAKVVHDHAATYGVGLPVEDVYDAVAAKHGLSVHDFHRALAHVFDADGPRSIKPGSWARGLYDHPRPEVLMPHAGKHVGYIQPGEAPPPSAPAAAPALAAAPAKSAGKPVSQMSDEEFAAKAQAHADAMPHGYGPGGRGNKVFISDVYDAMRAEDPTLTRPEFDRRMLAAHASDRLDMSRADIVAGEDLGDVARSHIPHPVSGDFHLMRAAAKDRAPAGKRDRPEQTHLLDPSNASNEEQYRAGHRVRREDYRRAAVRANARRGGVTEEDADRMHRREVERALAAGKSVPPEVLADYPDLSPRAAPAATAPAGNQDHVRKFVNLYNAATNPHITAPRMRRELEAVKGLDHATLKEIAPHVGIIGGERMSRDKLAAEVALSIIQRKGTFERTDDGMTRTDYHVPKIQAEVAAGDTSPEDATKHMEHVLGVAAGGADAGKAELRRLKAEHGVTASGAEGRRQLAAKLVAAARGRPEHPIPDDPTPESPAISHASRVARPDPRPAAPASKPAPAAPAAPPPPLPDRAKVDPVGYYANLYDRAIHSDGPTLRAETAALPHLSGAQLAQLARKMGLMTRGTKAQLAKEIGDTIVRRMGTYRRTEV